ncbi:glutamate-cysteine ligase gsha [Mycobacterium tuberculosis T85]|nr:glutamate-cysteine ligase gsha [Mycobacterium tuberculosis T85]
MLLVIEAMNPDQAALRSALADAGPALGVLGAHPLRPAGADNLVYARAPIDKLYAILPEGISRGTQDHP